MILDPCLDALGLADITMRGSCDLALGDRKFSGNAQKRSRYCLLHQGTLLWDFDLGLIPHYLRQPEKQPEYREARGHLDFVINLPLDGAELRQRITASWKASPPADGWRPPSLETLLEEKYLNREWIERF